MKKETAYNNAFKEKNICTKFRHIAPILIFYPDIRHSFYVFCNFTSGMNDPFGTLRCHVGDTLPYYIYTLRNCSDIVGNQRTLVISTTHWLASKLFIFTNFSCIPSVISTTAQDSFWCFPLVASEGFRRLCWISRFFPEQGIIKSWDGKPFTAGVRCI